MYVCTGCGDKLPINVQRTRCEACGEPLEIVLSARDPDWLRAVVGSGPGAPISPTRETAPSHGSGTMPLRGLGPDPLLSRFAPLLPMEALGLASTASADLSVVEPPVVEPPVVDTPVADPSVVDAGVAGAGAGRTPGSVLTLGEGNTPLLRLGAFGESFGVPDLYVKVEGANPTGSFKDRGTVVGVQRARAAGFRRVGTVSTGNMAGSVAAYAARAGMEAVVLVSASIPEAKLAPIAAYGPRLIGVDGDYGALYELTLKLGPELGIAFINSDDPFRVEGQKTIAFEILLQFGSIPDVVIVPVSSGGHMAAVLKGFSELKSFGLTHRMPRLIGVQAAGCGPIAAAFVRGEDRIAPWDRADTIAKAIANPKPPSGNRLLRAARDGAPLEFVAVSDEDILRAYDELMTKAGVFAQPDAAASIAAARRLKETGDLTGAESVVCVLTGHGTKDLTPLTDGPEPDGVEQGVGLGAERRTGPDSRATEGPHSVMEICTLDDLPRVLRD